MNVKTALILGALAGQVDAVRTLQARGVSAHVCARDADGPGVQAADEFHITDITDITAVADLARRVRADIVYSVGSDIAMPTVAAVSEALGLPGFHSPEVTHLLRRKQAMRDLMNSTGISRVEYEVITSEDEANTWDRFPCVVKPVDAQGQRGISVVQHADEMRPAIREALAHAISRTAIIEDYLSGREISAHLIVDQGEMIFYLPSDRHVWDGPMVGVPRAHSLPLEPATEAYAEPLRQMLVELIHHLGVSNGPLYAQAICTPNGPRIVEIASRLDGCHLWRLLKHSTGIDILDAVFGRLLGEPWPDLSMHTGVAPATLEFILDDPATVVTQDYVDRALHRDAVFSEVQVPLGTTPRRTNDVVARLGYQIRPGM